MNENSSGQAGGRASGTAGGAGIGGEFISDLARRLAAALPEGARVLREDLATNFEALLQSAFARLDLVTREEFEVQQRVLAATREKLTRLEQALARLEAGAGEPGRPD